MNLDGTIDRLRTLVGQVESAGTAADFQKALGNACVQSREMVLDLAQRQVLDVANLGTLESLFTRAADILTLRLMKFTELNAAERDRVDRVISNFRIRAGWMAEDRRQRAA